MAKQVTGVGVEHNNGKLYAIVETVTPERAAELLANTTFTNRSLGSTSTKRITRQIELGCWRLNGETIKVSTEGCVLDGQHRLTAIIDSDIPCETLVAYNVDPKAYETIDIGKKRNIADAMAIEKQLHPKTRAGVAKYIFAYDLFVKQQSNSDTNNRMRFSTTLNNLTTIEILPFSRENADLLDRATEAGRRLYSAISYPHPLGAFYGLIYRINPQHADDICEALCNGKFDESNDQFRILRERLLKEAMGRRQPRQDSILAYCIKVYNYWIAGEQCSIQGLTIRKDEAFPLLGNKPLTQSAIFQRGRRAQERAAMLNGEDLELRD